jgi:hypothetical protein
MPNYDTTKWLYEGRTLYKLRQNDQPRPKNWPPVENEFYAGFYGASNISVEEVEAVVTKTARALNHFDDLVAALKTASQWMRLFIPKEIKDQVFAVLAKLEDPDA